MHEIKQLEDQWKKYRRKKLKPWLLGVLGLLFIAFSLLFLFDSPKKSHFIEELSKRVDGFSISLPSIQKDESNSVLVNGPLDRLELNQSKHSEDTIQVEEPLVDIPILDDYASTLRGVESKTSHNKPKMDLEIIETASVTAYEDVEKRFFQSKDIDDALFLAKSYFKRGNYKKAEFWAYEVNKLDSSIEESFLIFVKSKIKLGQLNEAKAILHSYLKYKDSKEAKIILESLEN